jgi:hypothetical protein
MVRYISLLFIVATCYASIINVPSDFAEIQDAINYASTEDTILISDGIYYEGLEIDKSITLMSNFIMDDDDSHIVNTILSGASVYNPIMITSNQVNLNLIGLSVIESADHGIHANSGTSDINLFISHSQVYNNLGCGINFSPYYYNISLEIKNSSIHGNSETAVQLSYAYGYIEADLDSVKIYNNQEGGIFIEGGENNNSVTISNSEFFNQGNSAIKCSNSSGDGAQLEVNNSKFYDNDKYMNGTYGNSKNQNLIYADYLVMRGIEFYDNNYFDIGCRTSGVIKDSKFYNNIGWGTIVDGISSDYGSIDIYRTKFYDNNFSAWFGDDDTFYPSDPFFYIESVGLFNCAIYDNIFGWGFISCGWEDSSNDGGIIYNSIVINNIIDGGSFFQNIEEVWFYNSIFLNNSCENINANYSVSDVEILSGVNNLTENIVLFLNDDFELDPESPCIDAGIPVPEYNDLDGTRNDIGIFGGPYAYPVWGCMNTDACNYNEYCDSPYSPNECMFDDGSCYFSDPGFNCNGEESLSIITELIPEVFALQQNYPNPFNPVTSIRYDLPQEGLVNVTIYDMKGRLVKTLVNGMQTVGKMSVQWNATNNRNEPVSAGLYLYTIQAGEFRQTKKMVLLK